jgi:hypothetical protein
MSPSTKTEKSEPQESPKEGYGVAVTANGRSRTETIQTFEALWATEFNFADPAEHGCREKKSSIGGLNYDRLRLRPTGAI